MWVYDMWCEIYFICCRARKSHCKSTVFSTDQSWKQRLKKKYCSYQKPISQTTCAKVINTWSIQLEYLKVRSRNQNLLPKNKYSLYIPNIIIVTLTPPLPYSFHCIYSPLQFYTAENVYRLPWHNCIVVSSIVMHDYKCWTVPITMELNICPTVIRKLR